MDLYYPDEHGVSKFDRYSHAEQHGGAVDMPEITIPNATQHIWEWFLDLHSTRQSGFGTNPITYQEVKAWAELTHMRPTPWEIRMLRQMDMRYLEVVGDIIDRRTKKTTSQQLGQHASQKRKVM